MQVPRTPVPHSTFNLYLGRELGELVNEYRRDVDIAEAARKGIRKAIERYQLRK